MLKGSGSYMPYIDKKVLLVASDFVYPPNHGDRVDIWNRILCLNKMGFKIDLVCTIKEKVPKEGAKSTSLSISIPKQSLNLPLDEILKNKANIILHFGLHDDSYRDFIFNLK